MDKDIKMIFEWQIDRLIREQSFGDDNGLTKTNVLKALNRTLSGFKIGKDIDVTTKTQNKDNETIKSNENNKILYDFIIFLMLKGMVNTKYQQPKEIIDQFINPDKYDLIDV